MPVRFEAKGRSQYVHPLVGTLSVATVARAWILPSGDGGYILAPTSQQADTQEAMIRRSFTVAQET